MSFKSRLIAVRCLPWCLLMLTFVISTADAAPPEVSTGDKAPAKEKWMALFDSKTLKGWTATEFGGEGEVKVDDGRIVLEMGNDLTGIHTKRELPKINYEVEFEAMRVDGSDFFCGLTFPVNDDSCSLIVGGWGGGVCGLSSLNGADASENSTTSYREFKSKTWYPIRLRVTESRIQAWIDGESFIDQDITDKKVSIRIELSLSRPFGFASWQTTAALRGIRIRQLDPQEIAASKTDQ